MFKLALNPVYCLCWHALGAPGAFPVENPRVTYPLGLAHTGVARWIASINLPLDVPWFSELACIVPIGLVGYLLASPLESLVYCPFPLGVPCLLRNL